MENEPQNANGTDVPAPKSAGKIWILIAALGLVAAFFFQWKNSLDQAAIAETDSGAVVRAKIEDSQFKIFYTGKDFFSKALLCDADGNVLGELFRTAPDSEIFRMKEEIPREKISRERFLRLVVPALKCDGKPVVLLVENPFL